jgi:hypothetical protein
MSPLEQAAFVKAYGNNVAAASDEDVAEFVRRYAQGEDLDYSSDYTTIMDAICMWNDGIRFAKAQAKKTLMDNVLDQIKMDVASGDVTAIEELLTTVDEKIMRGYLAEERIL